MFSAKLWFLIMIWTITIPVDSKNARKSGTVFNKMPVGFITVGKSRIPLLTSDIKKENQMVQRQFFIPPMFSVVEKSEKIYSSKLPGINHISFKIMIANYQLERKAAQLINQHIGSKSPDKVDVRTLPLRKLRLINITRLSPTIELAKDWTTNNRFRNAVRFTMGCLSKNECANLTLSQEEWKAWISTRFEIDTVVSNAIESSGKAEPDVGADAGKRRFRWRIYEPLNPSEIENASLELVARIFQENVTICQKHSLPEENGWCVFHKHRETSGLSDQSMNKTWKEYKRGFGDYSGEAFWGGLENIRSLVTSGESKLRIEWSSGYKTKAGYMEYDGFYIFPEGDRYRFMLGSRTNGTVSDIFYGKCGYSYTGGYRNDRIIRSYTAYQPIGHQFATYDHDLVCNSEECKPAKAGETGQAAVLACGWWLGGTNDPTTRPNYYDNRITYCSGGSMQSLHPDVVKMMAQ